MRDRLATLQTGMTERTLGRTVDQHNRPVRYPGPGHPMTIEPNPGVVTGHAQGGVLGVGDHATYRPVTGGAAHFTLVLDAKVVKNAVWTYEAPREAVAEIRGHAAFYPKLVEGIEESDAG